MIKMLALGSILLSSWALYAAEAVHYEYRLLSTNKTSTMEKEMNEAAQAGYSFHAAMGGETAFGGKEVVIVMGKPSGAELAAPKQYKLLATSRTSTMQKELQQAADEGYVYCGQTVFESMFGGKEVSVILEREHGAVAKRVTFRLLATAKTSTMQKELAEAGSEGFRLVGMAVGKTSMGGSEVVSILSRTEE